MARIADRHSLIYFIKSPSVSDAAELWIAPNKQSVFSRLLNVDSDGDEVTSAGRLFQTSGVRGSYRALAAIAILSLEVETCLVATVLVLLCEPKYSLVHFPGEGKYRLFPMPASDHGCNKECDFHTHDT